MVRFEHFFGQLEKSGQDHEILAWITQTTGTLSPVKAAQLMHLERRDVVAPFVPIGLVAVEGFDKVLATANYERAFVLLGERVEDGVRARRLRPGSRRTGGAICDVSRYCCTSPERGISADIWKARRTVFKGIGRIFGGFDEKYASSVATVSEYVIERGANIFAPSRWLQL